MARPGKPEGFRAARGGAHEFRTDLGYAKQPRWDRHLGKVQSEVESNVPRFIEALLGPEGQKRSASAMRTIDTAGVKPVEVQDYVKERLPAGLSDESGAEADDSLGRVQKNIDQGFEQEAKDREKRLRSEGIEILPPTTVDYKKGLANLGDAINHSGEFIYNTDDDHKITAAATADYDSRMASGEFVAEQGYGGGVIHTFRSDDGMDRRFYISSEDDWKNPINITGLEDQFGIAPLDDG